MWTLVAKESSLNMSLNAVNEKLMKLRSEMVAVVNERNQVTLSTRVMLIGRTSFRGGGRKWEEGKGDIIRWHTYVFNKMEMIDFWIGWVIFSLMCYVHIAKKVRHFSCARNSESLWVEFLRCFWSWICVKLVPHCLWLFWNQNRGINLTSLIWTALRGFRSIEVFFVAHTT